MRVSRARCAALRAKGARACVRPGLAAPAEKAAYDLQLHRAKLRPAGHLESRAVHLLGAEEKSACPHLVGPRPCDVQRLEIRRRAPWHSQSSQNAKCCLAGILPSPGAATFEKYHRFAFSQGYARRPAASRMTSGRAIFGTAQKDAGLRGRKFKPPDPRGRQDDPTRPPRGPKEPPKGFKKLQRGGICRNRLYATGSRSRRPNPS
eukprot:9486136-Pyramimonas_sp.AAC.2